MLINIYIVYAGLVLICIGMSKHYKILISSTPNKIVQNSALGVGSILLFVALYLLINMVGLSLGITYWVVILSPVVIFIALILTYKAKALLPISLVLFLISLIF